MSDSGVWVKVYPDDAGGGAPGAAVIGGHNGATVETGKVIGGKTYDIYTFTDATATNLSLTVDSAGLVDVLLVGGGGGGGFAFGAGGGAGGLLEAQSVYLDDANPHKVVVGSGGAPGVSAYVNGFNGEASTIVDANLFSYGGGGGASQGNGAAQDGLLGASGGGGAIGGSGGESIYPLGNNGGGGWGGGPVAGGGGGAAAAGQTAPSNTKAGDGGDGKDVSSFIGQAPGTLVLAGGGGGGIDGNTPGTGGDGGGGNGSWQGAVNGSDANPSTGSGGGGGGRTGGSGGSAGGKGGSGIVIVRVEV